MKSAIGAFRPQCPWSGFQPANFVSCEPLRCSIVREPLNTYTSIAYLVVAVFLLRRYWVKSQRSDLEFGILAGIIGIASLLGHGSFTRFFFFFDFAAQFVFFAYLISYNLSRLRPISAQNRLFIAGALIFFSSWPYAAFDRWGVLTVEILATFYLLLEVACFFKDKLPQYRDLVWCVTTFSVGFVFFLLDITKIICVHSHYFQMHSVWHILSAISIYFLANHYAQTVGAK